MFAVCVTFTIAPGQLASFMPLMLDQARASLSLEKGCSRFDVCTDPAEPDQVFLYEIYESPAAFQIHLDSAHFRQFDRDVAAMVTAKDVKTWRSIG